MLKSATLSESFFKSSALQRLFSCIHPYQWSVVRLALPPNTLCSGSASFGSAWGDESTPPRDVERGQVGSAA